MPQSVQTFSARNIGIGVCAAAFERDGMIICDISRADAQPFMSKFQAHLEALEMSWRSVFDVSTEYGYVWAYFDPEKLSGDQVRASARENYRPVP